MRVVAVNVCCHVHLEEEMYTMYTITYLLPQRLVWSNIFSVIDTVCYFLYILTTNVVDGITIVPFHCVWWRSTSLLEDILVLRGSIPWWEWLLITKAKRKLSELSRVYDDRRWCQDKKISYEGGQITCQHNFPRSPTIRSIAPWRKHKLVLPIRFPKGADW